MSKFRANIIKYGNNIKCQINVNLMISELRLAVVQYVYRYPVFCLLQLVAFWHPV